MPILDCPAVNKAGCGRVWPTVSSVTLGYREAAEQAVGNRTVSSPLPEPLLQFRSLGSCPDFPSRWTTSNRDEIIPSSPRRLRSWCVYHSSRRQTTSLRNRWPRPHLFSHTPHFSQSPHSPTPCHSLLWAGRSHS